MEIERLTLRDLDQLRHLQPEGWSDIIPEFGFYLKSPYCYPVKAVANGIIVGIGTAIYFKKSAWIAHIIVDTDYRNKGIGAKIVDELLQNIRKLSIDTCSLIATALGKPVYLKAGFREVTDYKFLSRSTNFDFVGFSENIIEFQEKYREDVCQLDRYVSGEDRIELISGYLLTSKLYVKNNSVCGFYLPELREGLIYATNEEAGRDLMILKYSQIEKAVIPSNNTAGLAILEEIGFTDTGKTGIRMILGKDLDWKPSHVYGRIGGNFG